MFRLKGYDLKVVHRWTCDPGLEPKSCIYIEGIAVADDEDVGIIGRTERSDQFHLKIYSDENCAQAWARFRQNEAMIDVERAPDSQEAQQIHAQYQLLDKTPPTAELTYFDYDWRMECNIPSGENLTFGTLANRSKLVETLACSRYHPLRSHH